MHRVWRITSGPAFAPEYQEIDYDDIKAIFKSKPENYKTKEERYPDGRFKSFTVETQ